MNEYFEGEEIVENWCSVSVKVSRETHRRLTDLEKK